MVEKLTAKQEAFAFSVGYESKSYSEAYREHYNVKAGTKPETIWRNGSVIAKNNKVLSRIKELKKQRNEEMKLSFSWSVEEAERDLRLVLKKNKNDIMRAEKNGENAKDANNRAVLDSVKILNEMRKDMLPEEEQRENAGIKIIFGGVKDD